MLVESLTTLAPAIPVWEQYRSFMEWSLDEIASFTGSAGVAIIVFTIIVKTLLLPLTIKATRSSKAMQEVAPKVKEIQKKYGKDRARASQETMALYQQYGVNPMAGCLPMLIQIPIFFGLYRAIDNLSKGNVGEWAHGFLWLESLSEADPWHLLPILAGVFQFVQTRMMRPANQPKSDDPQQQVMNMMMNFMPLMVVVFGWGFASGPVIYWVAQSAYSVVQQWFITGWGSLGEWFPWLPELPEHRRLGYQAPRALDEVVVVGGGNAAVERKGFGGWLQRKMEQAQQQAQERQQQMQQQGKGRPASNAKPATNGEVVDVDGEEAGEAPSPFAAKRRDASSSYQARVDAAAKFKSKSHKTSASDTQPASTAPRPRKKSRKR
ncbi:MAG TPA: YidC/Oxa1 family membrane protein insertase [Thermomicrobiales bacterium]|nr:YidC/Oxa1 family membrane protein insertase [Thermomicrobiales bacterium]